MYKFYFRDYNYWLRESLTYLIFGKHNYVQQPVDSFDRMLIYHRVVLNQLLIYLRRESIQPVQPVIGISRRRPQVTPQLGKFIPLQTNTLFGYPHHIQILKFILS